jgi:hypothetical protein
MSSSPSIKTIIATIMLLLMSLSMQVSSFQPSAVVFPSRRSVESYTRCHVTPNRNADKDSKSKTNKISGIGGLNFGKAPINTNTVSIEKHTRVVSKPKAKSIASKPLKKNFSKSTSKTDVSPTQTPWSTIILSFLIPWRNPNSLFLYMFIIVSVLGKLNENPH